jgi:hypothetical protein
MFKEDEGDTNPFGPFKNAFATIAFVPDMLEVPVLNIGPLILYDTVIGGPADVPDTVHVPTN